MPNHLQSSAFQWIHVIFWSIHLSRFLPFTLCYGSLLKYFPFSLKIFLIAEFGKDSSLISQKITFLCLLFPFFGSNLFFNGFQVQKRFFFTRPTNALLSIFQSIFAILTSPLSNLLWNLIFMRSEVWGFQFKFSWSWSIYPFYQSSFEDEYSAWVWVHIWAQNPQPFWGEYALYWDHPEEMCNHFQVYWLSFCRSPYHI